MANKNPSAWEVALGRGRRQQGCSRSAAAHCGRASGSPTRAHPRTSPCDSAAEAHWPQLEIEFAFPWRVMVAALIGGLLEAFIRQLLRVRWRDLIVAVLVAGLAVTLYVQGVNAFGLAFSATTSEIVTFVLAALGVYGGADLLERFVRWRARVA